MIIVSALRRRSRLSIGSLAVVVGLIFGIGGAMQTHAAFAACETDPVVSLSNGRTVTLSASIAIDPSLVSQVSYVLHVPRNITVTNVAYDTFGSLEQLSVLSDRNGHHYSAEVSATTTDGSVVPITTSMVVSGQNAGSISGLTGDVLRFSF